MIFLCICTQRFWSSYPTKCTNIGDIAPWAIGEYICDYTEEILDNNEQSTLNCIFIFWTSVAVALLPHSSRVDPNHLVRRFACSHLGFSVSYYFSAGLGKINCPGDGLVSDPGCIPASHPALLGQTLDPPRSWSGVSSYWTWIFSCTVCGSYPRCFHVLIGQCCRFHSLWTRTVHLEMRRFSQPRSPPSMFPSTPLRNAPYLPQKTYSLNTLTKWEN